MNAVAAPIKRKMPSAHALTRNQTEELPGELGSPPILIEVDRLEPHPDNPRDDFGNDDAELLELAESLKDVKLINPISVEAIDFDAERYRIIAGERRWRAAKLAGWKTIPANVCRMDRAAAVRLMIAENLARKNLNPIEEVRAIQLLMQSGGEGGRELTRHDAGPMLGKHPDVIRRKLTLLKLPKSWQDRIAKREIGVAEGIHLAVYAERPDVLAAVELDLAENPQRWPSGDGFLGQLRFIAERFDALPRANGAKPPPAGSANVPKLQRDHKTGNAFVEHNGQRLVMGRANTKRSEEQYAKFIADLPAKADTPAPLTRRSAHVDHKTEPDLSASALGNDELGDETIAKVLDSVFDVLDRLKPQQLDLVLTYISRRQRGAEGPEARLPPKRPARH